MSWDPAQYLKFANHRLRPAVDLLNRIDVAAPAEVYDLGAGTGAATRLLKARWPHARVTGVDASAEMLARAAAESPEIEWQQADLADLAAAAAGPWDLLQCGAQWPVAREARAASWPCARGGAGLL